MTETQWNYSAQVQRWYWHKEDGKTLIAGNNGHEPLTYWFSVWKDGIEIAEGDELGSIEEAKAAAEAV